jgi:large subunit ribosomal protein L6
MSRIAKAPVALPSGVKVELAASEIKVTGPKGSLEQALHPLVSLKQEDGELVFEPATSSKEGWAMAGTMRALVNNMVQGVSTGFQRKLSLVGVGYRAQAKSPSQLNLSLGFSHPVEYSMPAGVSVETPSATEIVVSGADKQKVGQVAAEIRGFRPPEPYKGKGVRYADEQVLRKEAKKK